MPFRPERAFFNLLFTFFLDFSCSCLQKALLLQSGNHRLCHSASSKSQLKTTGRCEPLDVEHLGHPIHIGMKPGNRPFVRPRASGRRFRTLSSVVSNFATLNHSTEIMQRDAMRVNYIQTCYTVQPLLYAYI